MRKLAESSIQQSIVINFNNGYCLASHSPRCTIFSVPNESETAWEAQKKINTGMMKGAADLVIVLPGQIVFVETKTPTGYQSPAQKRFEERVKSCGHPYHVCKTEQSFWETMNPYLIAAGLEEYHV